MDFLDSIKDLVNWSFNIPDYRKTQTRIDTKLVHDWETQASYKSILDASPHLRSRGLGKMPPTRIDSTLTRKRGSYLPTIKTASRRHHPSRPGAEAASGNSSSGRGRQQ